MVVHEFLKGLHGNPEEKREEGEKKVIDIKLTWILKHTLLHHEGGAMRTPTLSMKVVFEG